MTTTFAIPAKALNQARFRAEAGPAPHLMRGIQVSKIMVPCLRRYGVWIPAGVHPALYTWRE